MFLCSKSKICICLILIVKDIQLPIKFVHIILCFKFLFWKLIVQSSIMLVSNLIILSLMNERLNLTIHIMIINWAFTRQLIKFLLQYILFIVYIFKSRIFKYFRRFIINFKIELWFHYFFRPWKEITVNIICFFPLSFQEALIFKFLTKFVIFCLNLPNKLNCIL